MTEEFLTEWQNKIILFIPRNWTWRNNKAKEVKLGRPNTVFRRGSNQVRSNLDRSKLVRNKSSFLFTLKYLDRNKWLTR